MEIAPVDNYKSPNIPTRDYVDDNPEILNHIPRRWMSDAAVLTALAGTTMLISAARNCTAQQYEPAPKVAPIFNWGPGKGAFGCMSIVPPTFLSEEEAQEIISQEAGKVGIAFSNTQKPLNQYGKPFVRALSPHKGNKYPEDVLLLDGSDETRHIYFEFVSTDDARIWDKEMDHSSSVSEYDTERTANYIKDNFWKANEDGVYATFYDPIARIKIPKVDKDKPFEQKMEVYKEAAEKAKADSRDLLRKQVKGFIKWLKSEGVI
jgi:hypothetical protein